jgi:hypothetical protein
MRTCGRAPSTRSTVPLMKLAAGHSREGDGGGGLGLGAEAARGQCVAHGAQHVAGRGRVVVHAAGGDVARRHRVHAHAAHGPFGGGRLGEAHHARARRAAVAHVGHGAPDVGHDVDDGAAVRLHALQVALARHQEAAREVGVDHRLPALGRDGVQRRDVLAARVVHEPVDAALRGDDGADGHAHRVFLADVEGLRAGPAAGGFDLGPDRVELLLLAPDQHHVRAQRGELVRGAAADARAAAGDDDDLPVEQAGREDGAIAGSSIHVGDFRKLFSRRVTRRPSRPLRPLRPPRAARPPAHRPRHAARHVPRAARNARAPSSSPPA